MLCSLFCWCFLKERQNESRKESPLLNSSDDTLQIQPELQIIFSLVNPLLNHACFLMFAFACVNVVLF